MPSVITVENLGKKYTLHHQQREQYTALRDVVTNGVASFSRKLFSPFRKPRYSDSGGAFKLFWRHK
jgi:lipopolysaccharide transport system ATP-binding protein